MIDGLGIALLALVLLWIPFLSWKSNQRLRGRPLPFSRRRLFGQITFIEAILLGAAYAAAWSNAIELLRAPQSPLRAWGSAALFLVIMLATLRWRWATRPSEGKDRLYAILPHDAKEFVPYLALCVAAGVSEEVVYRGVAPVLLSRIIGNFVAAAVIVAAAFALAHAIQGWRSVVSIFVIAIGAQAIVWIGQSLLPVIVVHFSYDAIAGSWIPRWYERDAALTFRPPDAAPAADFDR